MVYTAPAFRFNEAGAWWLCLETLRLVDRELRSIDAMFADKGLPRFDARRVAAVDSPERLASYVQTDGWLPINATIHVSDLVNLIKIIGGDEMYGRSPLVSLRELIQNACDAIRARQVYEKRGGEFGRIKVMLSAPELGEHWLEVIDNGIGMSQRVLTDYLLDFGRSFWGSSQMQEEFPGLVSSGFKPTGKYGIGFFSVFMVANRVLIVTRRSDAAARETLVMEFSSGLEGRPTLRPATRDEQLLDGGTHVKLRLKLDPRAKGGLLVDGMGDPKTLQEVCSNLCPASSVDLFIKDNGHDVKVVSANDWLAIDGEDLLARLGPSLFRDRGVPESALREFYKRAGANVRPLKEENGDIVGRALITVGTSLVFFRGSEEPVADVNGVIVVGGLRSVATSGIAGILAGRPVRASRDDAEPVVSRAAWKTWAEEQAGLVPDLWPKPAHQVSCAQYIRMCGGHTKQLPICMNQERWLSAEQVAEVATSFLEVILLDSFTLGYSTSILGDYSLMDNVFISGYSGIPGMIHSSNRGQIVSEYGEVAVLNTDEGEVHRLGHMYLTIGGAVVEAICQAWGVSLNDLCSVNDLRREKDIKVGWFGEKDLILDAYRIKRP